MYLGFNYPDVAGELDIAVYNFDVLRILN